DKWARRTGAASSFRRLLRAGIAGRVDRCDGLYAFRSGRAMRLPGFHELPVHVGRMIQVEDQAFPAIDKSAAKNVVLDEGERWIEDRIRDEDEERIAVLPPATERGGGGG